MSSKTNMELAADVGNRFEFYIVALTFTVLAFALQAGDFNGSPYRDAMEALSWAGFLLSGLVGLSRLEYIPVMYRVRHHLNIDVPADPKAEEALPELERSNQLKYKIQRWLFTISLVLLVVARMWAKYSEYY